MQKNNSSSKLAEHLWDLWCLCSIVGIWPRWIEPQLVNVTHLHLPIANLPLPLQDLHIVAFSDIHMRSNLSPHFLQKVHNKIQQLKPDILVFLGDFICYSKLTVPDRLQKFFNSLQAPFGCYAVLGNHDYAHNVSINSEGYYDIVDPTEKNFFFKAWTRLTTKSEFKKAATEKAKAVDFHQNLISLLKLTPFTLLHNETKVIPI